MKITCCYPECGKPATKTGIFGDGKAEDVLGDVPLCNKHFDYVQDEANQEEVEDLFGTHGRFVNHLTGKVKEMWGKEA